MVRLAQGNRMWGYDRMVGALVDLGYTISGQTVGNILKRHGIPPAPERRKTTTWNEFIRTHTDVLVATDFLTTEIWRWCGLVTYYVLFFIHLGSRKVYVAGVAPHPHERWMVQMACNITVEQWGFLTPGQYLIHDQGGKYCPAFQHIIDDTGVKRIVLPPRSPNLNAYAERWVRSVKEEVLSRFILFGERALWYALTELSDVAVIVDVLSFCTCVDIAVSRGAVIFPCVWRDARATAFARDLGAELAGPRGQTRFSSRIDRVYAIEKAERELGYRPAFNFAEYLTEASHHSRASGCSRPDRG